MPFTLQLGDNHVVSRSGSVPDTTRNLQLVIEMDGQVALKRNAANEASYTYYRNLPGHSYRAWLEAFIDGRYRTVSNVVSYRVEN